MPLLSGAALAAAVLLVMLPPASASLPATRENCHVCGAVVREVHKQLRPASKSWQVVEAVEGVCEFNRFRVRCRPWPRSHSHDPRAAPAPSPARRRRHAHHQADDYPPPRMLATCKQLMEFDEVFERVLSAKCVCLAGLPSLRCLPTHRSLSRCSNLATAQAAADARRRDSRHMHEGNGPVCGCVGRCTGEQAHACDGWACCPECVAAHAQPPSFFLP